jgi:hydrogenase maturation protein HypF
LPLPGGALAIQKPWRAAAAWCYALLGEAGLERAAGLLRSRAAPHASAPSPDEIGVLQRQVDADLNVPLTTSCGRLFDVVAALAGLRHEITYEGQAAVELEMVSRGGADAYPFVIGDGVEAAAIARRHTSAGPPDDGAPAAVVNLAPLVGAVLTDLEAGASPGEVGSRLHATVSAFTLEACRRVRAASGIAVAALSGGVFQNRLLADLCEAALAADGFEVLADGLVPCNDGGVALGQAAVAGYTVLHERGELPSSL